MHEEEKELDEVFARYRWACAEPDASAQFMPNLWSRIQTRNSFAFTFGRLGKAFAAATLVLFLGLAGLNMAVPAGSPLPSYPDALLSDATGEQTLYSEALPPAPPDGPASLETTRDK